MTATTPRKPPSERSTLRPGALSATNKASTNGQVSPTSTRNYGLD
jgi:hypothetical protein